MFKTNSCVLFKFVDDFSELRVQAQGVTMPKIGLRKLELASSLSTPELTGRKHSSSKFENCFSKKTQRHR